MKRARFEAFLNAIRTVRENIDDTTALTVPNLYPEWIDDTSYALGDRVLYQGLLYKCLQTHNAQALWNPIDAPSLWARVLIPDPEGEIPEWIQPDSTNAYMTGDKVRHNDKTWESTIDNNVWQPGVYGWTEVIESN